MGVCVYPVAGAGVGGYLYRGGNFDRNFISTTPIGKPISILPRASIPPAPSPCLSPIALHILGRDNSNNLF